jgi:drug/metabolite transporter (DMT)-like permease
MRAYLLMLAVVAVWGATFVVVKDALADASPLAFNLVRMTLAFAVLAVAYHRHWRRIGRRELAAGAGIGFFLAMGYQFQTAGLARTTPSKSALITGMVVVLVPILSAVKALRPRGARVPGWNAFAGAVLAFAGILLLTVPAAMGGVQFDFRSVNLGDLLSLGCAIGFAFHCLALGHLSPKFDFQQLALLQIGFCALFMAASLPLLEHPFLHWTSRLIVALLVAALLATAAAFSIQSWVQSVLPATHTALILTLEPVFAVLTAILFYGERLSVRSLSGAVLILGGIALTELVNVTPAAGAHEASGY